MAKLGYIGNLFELSSRMIHSRQILSPVSDSHFESNIKISPENFDISRQLPEI